MYILSAESYIVGIGALILVAIGFFYGFQFIYLYHQTKKRFMPIVAILGFGGGMLYAGYAVNFINLLILGTNLDKITVGLLNYTFAPFDTLLSLYLGFSIFNAKRVKLVVIIYFALMITYWIFIFAFPNTMILANTPASGDTIETSTASIVNILTIVCILSLIVILSIPFFLLARKVKRTQSGDAQELRLLYFEGWGWMIFGIGCILDAIVPPDMILLTVFARILNITAFLLVFHGFKGGR
jgi:hypothetical protein